MPNFGLITEGPTDQIVIENILSGYFDDSDIVFNPIQPLRDETDKNRIENIGGWTLVLEYCGSTNFQQIFSFNDYIIIQIDTDVCNQEGFGVEKRKDGVELTCEELIESVKERLINIIGTDYYERHSAQIFFAISVDSIECWLLPIYYRDNRKAKTTGCLETLNRELPKKKNFTIAAKTFRYYDEASEDYLRSKIILAKYKENPSLRVFMEEIIKTFPLPSSNGS